jgi:hypothetical protein
LAASGAFRGEPPEFDPACAIHHWDLSGLSRVEQQQATDVILRQIYEAAVQSGRPTASTR